MWEVTRAMIGQKMRRAVGKWDTRRRKRHNFRLIEQESARPGGPKPVEPVWPLPRRAGGMTDEQVRAEFAKFPLWHYAYAFQGGLSFSSQHKRPGPVTDEAQRPLKRFR